MNAANAGFSGDTSLITAKGIVTTAPQVHINNAQTGEILKVQPHNESVIMHQKYSIKNSVDNSRGPSHGTSGNSSVINKRKVNEFFADSNISKIQDQMRQGHGASALPPIALSNVSPDQPGNTAGFPGTQNNSTIRESPDVIDNSIDLLESEPHDFK